MTRILVKKLDIDLAKLAGRLIAVSKTAEEAGLTVVGFVLDAYDSELTNGDLGITDNIAKLEQIAGKPVYLYGDKTGVVVDYGRGRL